MCYLTTLKKYKGGRGEDSIRFLTNGYPLYISLCTSYLKFLKVTSGDAEEALNAPQNKHLRIENKNFYFDIKRNQQGRYMSILEVLFILKLLATILISLIGFLPLF